MSKLEEYYCRINELEQAISEIYNWANAYPVEAFQEPDFNKVRELLGGSILSCVSASNMRHVLSGVKKICEKVIK